MPQKLFLYDYKTDQQYSYHNLLDDINSRTELKEYCYSKNLYDTFLSIITGIIHKCNLVLLDSDFSASELSNLGIAEQNLKNSVNVQPVQFSSLNELIQAIQGRFYWHLSLFSSGTTGIPKQVIHTRDSLTRAVRVSDKQKDSIWGFAYNPAHIAGLQVFFQAFFNGNTIINLFEAPRNTVLSLIDRFGITNVSATPTFYRMLMPVSEAYPSILKLTSGGEKFDPNLSASLLSAFPNARLQNIYASTEAGTILESYDDSFSVKDSSLCMIINDELHIHRSLLGNSDEFGLTEGEWYATGDIVEVISDNPLRFRFKHRRNEMINVGGYKVNPYEVEQILETIPNIQQAYVYGKSNPVSGNILMADLVATSSVPEREIREFLRDKLQPYKIPRIINFVQQISLTRTGKLKRT